MSREESEKFDRAMREELNRRIVELAGCSEATFGPLNHRDWILTIALFVILPLVLVWVLR